MTVDPETPIWEFFNGRQDLGENRAECITCNKVMVGNAKQMRQHFGNHDTDWEQSPRAPKHPGITNFTVSTSKADQDKFDLKVGIFCQ